MSARARKEALTGPVVRADEEATKYPSVAAMRAFGSFLSEAYNDPLRGASLLSSGCARPRLMGRAGPLAQATISSTARTPWSRRQRLRT